MSGGRLTDDDDLLDALFDDAPVGARPRLPFVDDDAAEDPSSDSDGAWRGLGRRDEETEETPPTLIAAEAGRRA
ncbi:MAG TPA: hypothetical protein PKA64_07775, partial [Myxococcota bacterium]|nr:hypothetical protein [Myxococcota bacterium]